MSIINEYIRITSQIPLNKQKYIHKESVGNFMSHLQIMSEWDAFSAEKKILEYLRVVEDNIEDIDSYSGMHFFEKYIHPLGVSLEKYGFKRIMPMKYLFLYSVIIDSILFFSSAST